MPTVSTYLVFLAAALTLLVIPGPAIIYIVTRSIDQGRRAGLVSVLGVAVGSLFHIIAAALGLSALLASSAVAFNGVRYLGAAYLIYLGVRKFFSKDELEESAPTQAMSLRRIFFQGVLVNTFNPKTALFFFAFLPQFVDPARGPVAFQILFLGLSFTVLGMCSDGTWAVLAGTVGSSLKRHRGFLRSQRYVAGSVYLGLGLATAFAGSRRTQ
jgi:threonine/homoserine/homoserine lactone efflux protein